MMAIINRNYFINLVKKKRDKSEKSKSKRKIYYDKSCPNCGIPIAWFTIPLNKFAQPFKKKVKCKLCKGLLSG